MSSRHRVQLNWGNLAGGYVAFVVATVAAVMAVAWSKEYEVEQLGLALTCESTIQRESSVFCLCC